MAAGRIILLNGSSSAGKTTLAVTMQQLLRDPWHHIALDQFRDGMGGRYRGLNSPPGTPGARGLNVVPVDAKAREQWRALAESTYPKVRGDFVPADAFDTALKYRDEYRKQKSAAKK